MDEREGGTLLEKRTTTFDNETPFDCVSSGWRTLLSGEKDLVNKERKTHIAGLAFEPSTVPRRGHHDLDGMDACLVLEPPLDVLHLTRGRVRTRHARELVDVFVRELPDSADVRE